MYATELIISGKDRDFLEAREFFLESISDEGRSIEEIKEAAVILVKIALLEDDVMGILKYALKDVAVGAGSEMCYFLGEFFYGKREYSEAAIWYYNCIYECKPILYERIPKVYGREKLAKCYEIEGNLPEAKRVLDEIER